MLRGPDYINKLDFHGPITRPGKNSLDISDINGAKPKGRFESFSSQQAFSSIR